MIDAGIDVVMPVTWNSLYMRDEDKFSLAGLDPLSKAWDELKRAGYNPPMIAMFYDTSTLRANSINAHIDLTLEDGKKWLFQTVKDFYNRIPEHQRATIDGKPLIYFYTFEFAKAFDRTVFPDLRQRFKAEFGSEIFLVNNDKPILDRLSDTPLGSELLNQIRIKKLSEGFANYINQRVKYFSSQDYYLASAKNDEQYLESLYQNVLLRCPDAEGYNYWFYRLKQENREK
jgi:hypothetical protein